MKKMLIALALVAGLSLTGCYKFVAVHPDKTEADFRQDQARCEEEAREFAMERREHITYGDEINRARRCMRDLGWEYHFRKSGK